MRAEVKIVNDIEESYVVIYTDRITDEIGKLLDYIGTKNEIITVNSNDRTLILSANEIYMVRVEEEKTVIYCKNNKYISKKRLCELEKNLKFDFMKISKTTLINLKYISGIEASFGGMMLLIMKNGCKDYVSRKYLPEFKSYLGL